MVHALEISHGLLVEKGALVNIQPIGKPRSLEVHGAGEIKRAGFIRHKRNFEDHHLALKAAAKAVRAGLFSLEREQTFPFLYHAPSLAAFQDWLAENSETAILDQPTVERARALTREMGEGSKVVMRDELTVGLLRPC